MHFWCHHTMHTIFNDGVLYFFTHILHKVTTTNKILKEVHSDPPPYIYFWKSPNQKKVLIRTIVAHLVPELYMFSFLERIWDF